jgi:hypothetical protein
MPALFSILYSFKQHKLQAISLRSLSAPPPIWSNKHRANDGFFELRLTKFKPARLIFALLLKFFLGLQLLAAQAEGNEPLDALPSASVPLLPDLSDDRRSNDGLPKPNPGPENPSLAASRADTLQKDWTEGGVPRDAAEAAPKEGLLEVDVSVPRSMNGAPNPKPGFDAPETGFQELLCRQDSGPGPEKSGEGVDKSLKSGASGNEKPTDRLGERSDTAKAPLSAPLTDERLVVSNPGFDEAEHLSKSGSNESVLAEVAPEKGDPASGASLNGQPTSEGVTQIGRNDGTAGSGALEIGGSFGGAPGGGHEGAELVQAAEAASSQLQWDQRAPPLGDVSISQAGGTAERVKLFLQGGGRWPESTGGERGGGAEAGSLSLRAGMDLLSEGEKGGDGNPRTPPLPLSLCLLHTLATELRTNSPGVNWDSVNRDSAARARAKQDGAAWDVVNRDALNRDCVNPGSANRSQDGVNPNSGKGPGSQPLAHAHSLPPKSQDPWLTLRPQGLQRHLSVPEEVHRPPGRQLAEADLDFLQLGTRPSAQGEPTPVGTTQIREESAGLFSSEAIQNRGPADDFVNADSGLSRDFAQTLEAADLSLATTSWQQEGVDREWGPKPVSDQRGPVMPGREPLLPAQAGQMHGAQGLSWDSHWAEVTKSAPVLNTGSGVLEAMGPLGNNGIDGSVNMLFRSQPAASLTAAKPETGMYSMCSRGGGRRGSVSLHIGPLPVVDAVTAAEARKRRREVTKSKFGPSSNASAKVQKGTHSKVAR